MVYFNLRKINSSQGILREHIEIVQVRTHNHDLYILDLLSAPREYVLYGLVPGLVWLSFWPPSPSMPCHVQPSILLFISMYQISHLTPSLLSGWLLTNVQVNNITTLHDTHEHMYIHHIGITILLPFYTSSTLLGRPAGTDPSRLIHWEH
jgi:hypothetical protein